MTFDKKEYHREYGKKYRELNKERDRERRKKYSEDNKERLSEYTKKYRKINREKIIKNKKLFDLTIDGKYISYKGNAKRRGINFLLSKEEFKTFWQKNCSYCNSEISTIGIDRINNSIGYQHDNCISCCQKCNRMKMDDSIEDFIEHIRKILDYKSGLK